MQCDLHHFARLKLLGTFEYPDDLTSFIICIYKILLRDQLGNQVGQQYGLFRGLACCVLSIGLVPMLV